MYELSIYLAGEIHSDWRNRFRTALEELGIDDNILGPGEDHSRSDDIGEDIPGKQPDERYLDLRSLLKKYRDHWDVLRVLVRRSLTKYSVLPVTRRAQGGCRVAPSSLLAHHSSADSAEALLPSSSFLG